MLPYEVFEEYAKKRLKQLLEKGEKPTVIGGFIDFFGDAAIVACSKCGVPVFVRPWVLEAITEHNLKVSCICCADPKDLKGQVAMDFAKIEGKVEQQICLEIKKTWKQIMAFPGPFTSTPYSAWRSPDGKLEVGIHDADNEIFCVHIVETDQWSLNPRDIQRLLALWGQKKWIEK
jgi:hypothetical protein